MTFVSPQVAQADDPAGSADPGERTIGQGFSMWQAGNSTLSRWGRRVGRDVSHSGSVVEMFDRERRVSFPLTELAPSSARRWLADRSTFPSRVHDLVLLLVSELVANSVSHSGLAAPEEVEVAVRRIPGGVHVEVVDDGVGIDDPEPPEPNHFGLRFVRSETDRWGYSNHPTRVWFEIIGDAS